MTGIGKADLKRHDQAVCTGCRFWNRYLDWCNYGEIMHRSRLASGGKLLPEGGCKLYEQREDGDETQNRLRERWGAGATYSEARKKIGAKLSNSVFRQMESLYKEGKTDAEIAAELGIGKSSVGRWRYKNCLESNYFKKIREAKWQA